MNLQEDFEKEINKSAYRKDSSYNESFVKSLFTTIKKDKEELKLLKDAFMDLTIQFKEINNILEG